MIKGFKKGLAVVLSAAMVMSCMDTGMTVNAMTDNQIAVVQETDTEAESSTEETAETTKEETSKTEEAETERSKEETEEESKSEEVKSEEATDTVETEAETETQEETAKTESETETDTAETESETEADTAETESETEAGTATTEEATTEEVKEKELLNNSSSEKTISIDAEGGKIYFDPTNGYIVDAEKTVICAEIPEVIEGYKVEGIGKNAFAFCEIERIILPDGLKIIDERAFQCAKKLSEINFPDSLETIGSVAFNGCCSLEELHFGKNLKLLDSSAFYACTSLKKVYFDENLETINKECFGDCTFLKGAYFKGNAPKIGNNVQQKESVFHACSDSFTIYFIEGKDGWKIPEWHGYKTKIWKNDEEKDIFEYSDEEGTVNGKLYFDKRTGYIVSADKDIKNVIIPEEIDKVKVIGIDDGAFKDCVQLESIVIADTVKEVRTGAFYNCESLSRVLLPQDIEVICSNTFTNCKQLKTINLTLNIKEIGIGAFAGSGLESISFPEGLLVIGEYAFCSTDSLKSINFSNTIVEIKQGAFTGNIAIEEVKLPDSLEKLDVMAFDRCSSLKSVYIGKKLKTIGGCAFASCNSLESVTFSEGLSSINYSAFFGCPLKEIVIPRSVSSIGHRAFAECTTLSKVYFKGQAPSLDKSFDECAEDLCLYYIEGEFGWTIPEYKGYKTKIWDITEGTDIVKYGYEDTIDENIGYIYFDKKTGYIIKADNNLSNIEIPEKIDGIEVVGIGERAFYACHGLISIVLPDTLTDIGDEAFYCCCSLKNIDLPKGIDHIGRRTFAFCGFETVQLPDNLQIVEEGAFSDCNDLEKVYLGVNLKSIEDRAFICCNVLNKVYFKGDAPKLRSFYEYRDGAFSNCSDGLIFYYIEGKEGWTTPEWNGYATKLWTEEEKEDICEYIDEEGTVNGKLYFDKKTGYIVSADKTITNVIIPDKIEGIEVAGIKDKAFEFCQRLQSVHISDNVKFIGNRAFYECYSLSNVVLSKNIDRISGEMFGYCGQLKSIELPASIKRISHDAFAWSGLESISFPEGLLFIGDNAFSSCKLKKINLPESLEGLGDYVFRDCTLLKSIYFGKKVNRISTGTCYNCKSLQKAMFSEELEVIEQDAFSCTALKKVVFPENLKKIENYAFYECHSLSKAYFKGDASIESVAFYRNNPDFTIYYNPEKENWNVNYYPYNKYKLKIWNGKDIEDIEIKDIEEQIYTGSQIRPEIIIYHGKTRLVKDIDYIITTYKYNVNAGSAVVEIKYKGNYSGNEYVSFDIEKADLSKVIVEDMGLAYNGKEQKKVPSLSYNGKILKEDKDYVVQFGKGNFKDPGTYKVTYTAIGNNFKGTITGYVTILDKSKCINKAKISLNKKIWDYTGNEIQPEVSVKMSGTNLSDKDYEVTYCNNIKPGKATAVIKGIGEYAGTQKVEFTIKKKTVELTDSRIAITVEDSVPILKGGCTPEPVVKYFDETLIKNKDYTVSYSKNKSVGTATVTVKGKGNYKGTVKKTFKITKKDLSTVNMRAQDIIFTGKAGKYVSKPVLTDSDNVQLSSADYGKVTYYMNGKPLGKKDKCEAGAEITVTVEGKGNYEGTASATYKLREGKKFGSAKITVETKSYTGKKIELTKDDIKVTYKNETLIYGKDYEIVENSYKNNIKKGTATVVIRGCDEYVGEKTVSFKIKSMQSR